MKLGGERGKKKIAGCKYSEHYGEKERGILEESSTS